MSRRDPSSNSSVTVPKRSCGRGRARNRRASDLPNAIPFPWTVRSRSQTRRWRSKSLTAPPTRYRGRRFSTASRRAASTLWRNTGGSRRRLGGSGRSGRALDSPPSILDFFHSLKYVFHRVLARERADLAGQSRREGNPHRVGGLERRFELPGTEEPDGDGCRAGMGLQAVFQPREDPFVGECKVDTNLKATRQALGNPFQRRDVLHGQLARGPRFPDRARDEDRQVCPHPGLDLLVEGRKDRDRHTSGHVLEDCLEHGLAFVQSLLDFLLLQAAQDSADPDRLVEP